MLDLFFHPDVASEVKSSYDWYQEQANGLGEDFLRNLNIHIKPLYNFMIHGQNSQEISEDSYYPGSRFQ